MEDIYSDLPPGRVKATGANRAARQRLSAGPSAGVKTRANRHLPVDNGIPDDDGANRNLRSKPMPKKRKT